MLKENSFNKKKKKKLWLILKLNKTENLTSKEKNFYTGDDLII